MDTFVQIESTILKISEFKVEIYDEKFGQNSAIKEICRDVTSYFCFKNFPKETPVARDRYSCRLVKYPAFMFKNVVDI